MFPNLEWWYMVIHAMGKESGHPYSILVTHFNNKFRFFSISDIQEDRHFNQTSRGKLVSKKGALDLRHHILKRPDIFRSRRDKNGEPIPFEYEIQTHAKDFYLSTTVEAIKPPMMIGGSGYLPIGKSGYSWYYSLTRLKAKGKLNLSGREEEFTGTAWIDHQWGPFFVSPVKVGKLFESYEWFCLQLDDGTDLMISNIFNRNNQLPDGIAYRSLHINRPNGQTHIDLGHQFIRTHFYKRPDKKINFSQWDGS